MVLVAAAMIFFGERFSRFHGEMCAIRENFSFYDIEFLETALFAQDMLCLKNEQSDKVPSALSNKTMPIKVTLWQQLSKNNNAKIVVKSTNIMTQAKN
ncbi:hypothetical protein GCM10016272_13920 [Psychrobacter glaciei]|uniref:Uncharacterized protein n=2 Tax=Psychrobacter glaciei TaxID=619771 RepID=A0ABQ3GQD1_9GAMM|nr:hypothetical protein [Psychrobacter glaciei]GHD31635.1 hypothetical protein GCM10016272_13920 [Psychrobacter glaciei]